MAPQRWDKRSGKPVDVTVAVNGTPSSESNEVSEERPPRIRASKLEYKTINQVYSFHMRLQLVRSANPFDLEWIRRILATRLLKVSTTPMRKMFTKNMSSLSEGSMVSLP